MKINWEFLFLIIAIIPPAVKFAAYFAQKSTNKAVQTMAERALIIVRAMEESGLSSISKKDQAVKRLAAFAREVNIPVTDEQLDDYIESSVNVLRTIGIKQKG